MRRTEGLRYLGVLALLFASCCLCCRAHLRVPQVFETRGGWPMLGGNSGHTGLYSGHLRLPLKLLWRFRTKGPIVSSPVVAGELVCLGSLDKRLYLLSARDGQLYGFLKRDSSISASPVISGKTVFFATELGDDAVYAVDLSRGDLRWKADIFDVSASLTLANQTIFVSSGSGTLYALSAQDGRQLWQFRTEGQRSSSAAVAEGLVYFGSDDGVLYALDAGSGQEVWRQKLGEAIWSSPTAHEGQILVGTFDGEIYALKGDNGVIIWAFQRGGRSFTSSAVCSGTVYVGSDEGTLYALDAGIGTLRWSYEVGSPICGAPLATSELVIFGASDGVVYVLDGGTGELRCSYQTGGAIVSSPSAWQGRIFIGSKDGYLYVFGEGSVDSSATDQPIP